MKLKYFNKKISNNLKNIIIFKVMEIPDNFK